jgi:osmotically-inducible protein OsmY
VTSTLRHSRAHRPIENAAVKARATELAKQVAGVREVVNNLKIQ